MISDLVVGLTADPAASTPSSSALGYLFNAEW